MENKKIRIYGPCGSGKSYLAKELAKVLKIRFYETDNMIWNRKLGEKYTREKRQEILLDVLEKEDWIIEGAQYKWSHESFDSADLIIMIDPSPVKLTIRVLSRFIKMQIRPGDYNYKQNFKELLDMLRQNKNYFIKTRQDFLLEMQEYKEKLIHLNNSTIDMTRIKKGTSNHG